MPESAPPRRHLLRWIVLACVVVLVALIMALVVHVHALLQPQRFTALLEGDLSAVGLTLNLQSPAQPQLFPHPGVRLQGITLGNTGSATPLLTANSATIVVPWRALLHGDVAIERVDITSPRVDLGELKALLAHLPHHAGPPSLPTIATGIHMTQGTLTAHGTPLLFGFNLNAGSLAPGQPFQLDASARDPSGRKFGVSLTTVPSPARHGVIDFNPTQIRFTEQGGITLQLAGKGQWRGGDELAMQLKGTLLHATLAAAPATTSGATVSSSTPAVSPLTADKVALGIIPSHGTAPMTVTLTLDGTDAHVDARLRPTQFGQWWSRLLAAKPGKAQAPVPMPFTGKARIESLDLGWLKASGLRIDAGPDIAPASAATAAAATPSH